MWKVRERERKVKGVRVIVGEEDGKCDKERRNPGAHKPKTTGARSTQG